MEIFYSYLDVRCRSPKCDNMGIVKLKYLKSCMPWREDEPKQVRIFYKCYPWTLLFLL